MRKMQLFLWLLLISIAGISLGCDRTSDLTGPASLELKSSSFRGDIIPEKFSSCNGQDGISPELSWSTPPDHTQSWALIAYDRDSRFGFQVYTLAALRHSPRQR